MSIAVITLGFDPVLTVAGRALRLETLALAGVALICLLVAAYLAGRTPALDSGDADFVIGGSSGSWHLRRDDLLFIVLGVIPGAVAIGRLGYAAIHLDYYAAHPGALIDASQGSFSLSGAVVGGTLTGAYVVRLLEAPVGRWLHLAAPVALLALALGKAATVLGGDGQGAFWDGTWATRYSTAAAWGSLHADVAAHPAQVYEALLTLAVLLVVLVLRRTRLLRSPDARGYLVAVAAWALARAVAAAYWRDATVLGPLRAEQLVCLAIAVACLVLLPFVPRPRPGRRRLVPAPRD